MRKNNQIYCNCCGRMISQNIQKTGEDFLQIDKTWGFFSGKDGEIHRFTLCENCYDRMRDQFSIPVDIRVQTELL